MEYDLIVVGLGCVGLSTVYHAVKRGWKVLGIERNHDVGALGSGSYGHTRIWRVPHFDNKYNQMMEDGLPLWRQIEEESGKRLISEDGILLIDKIGSRRMH